MCAAQTHGDRKEEKVCCAHTPMKTDRKVLLYLYIPSFIGFFRQIKINPESYFNRSSLKSGFNSFISTI